MQPAPGTDPDRVEFPGLGTTYLIRSEQTEGRFALVEHDIPPRKLAAPMHVHEREDEYSYVLEGRVGVQIGDDVRVAGPGELVAKPRRIPHAFWNAGDEPARLLELISPGGSSATSKSWHRTSLGRRDPTSSSSPRSGRGTSSRWTWSRSGR